MEYERLKDVEIRTGSRIFVSYLILRVDVCDQKNGGKYLNITIGDQDKVYAGVKLFGASENTINTIVSGKVYRGSIDVKEYNGGNSLVIYNIEEDTLGKKNEYLSYEDGYHEDTNKLMSYISGLDGDLKKLVETTINMTNNRFWYWTAARGHHHSRLGGLVVHTVEVIENALSIYENCNMPKYCDRNVLIASSILHDVGKCFEYKVDEIGNTEYSTQGVLEGHISIGLRMVDRAYNELKSNGEEIPISKMESIRHCILAHHGKLEYGSPVTPATVEATILNFSDNISASLNKMRTTMKDMEPEQFVSNWTSEGYKNCYLSEDVIDRKEETI